MNSHSATTKMVRSRMIRLSGGDDGAHHWFVETTTEEFTNQIFQSEPHRLSGELKIELRAINPYGLLDDRPTAFGGSFEYETPGRGYPSVKLTNGYVLVEASEHRRRGLGTYLMGSVIQWLQKYANNDAVFWPIELEANISPIRAERVCRFYNRFGIQFEADADGRVTKSIGRARLSSLRVPEVPASVHRFEEVEGWIALFREVRQTQESRHGDVLRHQWREFETSLRIERYKRWALAAIALLSGVFLGHRFL